MKFITLAVLLLAVFAATAAADEEKTCPLCVTWLDQAYGELIQAIAQLGVLDTCGDLCGLLNSHLEGTICDLLCDYVGIEEFIKIVDNSDFDAIYDCQELHVCAINDNAAANITHCGVVPLKGYRGSTFDISSVISVTSETGAGMIELVVQPPSSQGFPFGDAEIFGELPVGDYNVGFQLQATPNEMENFGPGKYQVQVAVCNGECGSDKPHTKTLSLCSTSFEIIAKDDE